MLLGQVPHRAQKGQGGVGERGLAAVNQPQHALELKLVNRDAHQFASFEFVGDGQVRHQRHAVAHGHKALDGLDGGQIDAHIERRAVTLKGLNHLAPQRRGDVVGDEVFLAQVVDGDPGSLGERDGAG